MANVIKPEIDEIEALKFEIEKNLNTISALVSKETDKSMFNEYKKLYKEYNDEFRMNMVKFKANKTKEKNQPRK